MMFRILPVVLLLTCAARVDAATPVPDATDAAGRAAAAIERFVAERMGHDAKVIVRGLKIFSGHPIPGGELQAVAMAGARIGGPVQFALLAAAGTGENRRFVEVGRVLADTRVEVPHLCATRVIEGGQPVDGAAVTEVDGEVSGVAIQRLPRLADLQGSRAAHPIADGALIAPADVRLRAAVRPGQRVRAIVRVQDAEASATLIAEQSGAPGTVVRVVNPATGKAMRARVVGDGVVEVVND